MQYLLLTLFLLINGTAMAQTTDEDSEVYPGEFVRDYNQECIQTSMTEGLESIEAEQLCDCTINKFQSKYTLEEFKQLTAASVRDKKAEMALVEVGQVCFEQILYEQ